jgi:GNAT superfamily N-acetyltransferase
LPPGGAGYGGTIDTEFASVPGVVLRLVDGRQAVDHSEDLAALHAEACPGDESAFGRRFAVHRRQPGFVLAEARHGEFLVGYAYGAPLRQSTSWWRDLTSPLPEDVTEEYPGRTFALMEMTVRPAWRRQGIGSDLHDLLLADRREERATTVVPPGSAASWQAFQSWGWTKVARTREGSRVSDVLLIPLRDAG